MNNDLLVESDYSNPLALSLINVMKSCNVITKSLLKEIKSNSLRCDSLLSIPSYI